MPSCAPSSSSSSSPSPPSSSSSAPTFKLSTPLVLSALLSGAAAFAAYKFLASRRSSSSSSSFKSLALPASPSLLLRALDDAIARASRASSLVVPASVTYQLVPTGPLQCHVTVATNLSSKPTSAPAQKKKNPFLPPFEEGLYVCDLPPSHRLLLNKFNVAQRHVLVVTSEFESQESPLYPADFEATLPVLEALHGLAYFNCGPHSGASQPHKHIQVVPLAFLPNAPVPPLHSLVTSHAAKYDPGCVFSISALPFLHACVLHQGDLYKAFDTLAYHLSVSRPEYPNCSFNLLFTKEWMFMVPRSASSFEGLAANAVAFAGTLLVRSEEEKALALRHLEGSEGLVGLLKKLTFPVHHLP